MIFKINHSDLSIKQFCEVIATELSQFGYQSATYAVNNLLTHLIEDDKFEHFSETQKTQFALFILDKIYTQMLLVKNNKYFLELIVIIKKKAMEFSCENILKLVLYCDSPEKIKNMHYQFCQATKFLKQLTNQKIPFDYIKNILGYIFSLNLNQYSFSKIIWLSILNSFNLFQHVKHYSEHYLQFISDNFIANNDAKSAINRRETLRKAGLLQTSLQRDPEEVANYENRMSTSSDDKAKLLDDILLMHDQTEFLVLDIGAGGGAIFKALIALAYHHSNKKITYYGIEFDKQELINLQLLLNQYRYQGRSGHEVLQSATFINGNLLELADIVRTLDFQKKSVNQYLIITLSAVIHEVYSYCKYDKSPTHSSDLVAMTKPIKNRYNQEVIYKIYSEALQVLSEHPGGGSLNIRDGVMHYHPYESVTFSLQNNDWLTMFREFISDKKYQHLIHQIQLDTIAVGKKIQLPAMYAQEFMLKANWGPRSFGNEINEVYCFMTLADHLKLAKRAAETLKINIDIREAKEYTQSGYQQHITRNQIIIESGFGANKFPSTNMRLKLIPRLSFFEEVKTQKNQTRISADLSPLSYQPALELVKKLK